MGQQCCRSPPPLHEAKQGITEDEAERYQKRACCAGGPATKHELNLFFSSAWVYNFLGLLALSLNCFRPVKHITTLKFALPSASGVKSTLA